jgi:hypothetical protein
MGNARRYEDDFYGWATEQAALLRAGRVAEADLANIAEEIDSMGRSEKRELVSRLAVLFAHLLKWRFQPALRGNSWRLTVREQRRKLARHLHDNPSLRPLLGHAAADAYGDALLDVQRETGLAEATFPPTSPWTIDEVLDDSFLPQ